MNQKPHVIIIMADQLRADVLGKGYTPNIDAVRGESVVFSTAYCASPLCVPARGAFFTGRYPNETGCLINPWEPMDASHGCVRAGTFNLYNAMERDWDSWHAGKQHFYIEKKVQWEDSSDTRWLSLERGYKTFLQEHGKRAPGGKAFRGSVPEMAGGRITRRKQYSIPTTGYYEEGLEHFYDGYILTMALEALEKRNKDKPFMMNAMFLAPHPPLEIPDPWFSMYKGAELAMPDNVGVWGPRQSPLQLYNLTGVIGNRYTREDWRRIWPVYLGLVSLLDHCVGRLIDELKRQGMYDDSLIVFTSDHGEMFGSHGLWQKMCMYEESVRIPLSFKFPACFTPAVHHCDVTATALDVLPTLCDYLGIEAPEDLSGKSLLPAMTEPKESTDQGRRGDVYIQYDGNGARGNFQRCVVRDGRKLIVDLFKDELFLELYALGGDAGEMHNLAFEPEQRELVEDLLASLREHMARTDDLLAIPDNSYERFIADYSGHFRDE